MRRIILFLIGIATLPLTTQGQGKWGAPFLHPGTDYHVYTAAEFEGDLIIGGLFRIVDQTLANRIARFDGTTWVPMGDGFDDAVHSLFAFNGELYAGGEFRYSANVEVNRVARWDGQSWQPLGSGINGDSGIVRSFLKYEGNFLVAGDFSMAGEEPRASIALWDGVEWQDFCATTGFFHSGDVGSIRKLIEFRGEPVAIGGFDEVDGLPAHNAARWNGSSWVAMGELGHPPYPAKSAISIGDKLLVYASGEINTWNGVNWEEYCDVQGGLYDMIEFEGELYGTGLLPDYKHIARWDGESWNGLSVGLWNPYIRESSESGLSLCLYNDLLVVTSSCQNAGNLCTPNLAAWDGSQWVPPTDPDGIKNYTGLDWNPSSLGQYQGKLLAGGSFNLAYSTRLNGVGLWDGQAWAPLGEGFPHYYRVVRAFEETADGLIAAGNLAPFMYTARWDGSDWHQLGDDLDGTVFDIHYHDGYLFAGGTFTETGGYWGEPAMHIAWWDGDYWRPLDDHGLNDNVGVLGNYQGDLVVGGEFTEAGGLPAGHIAYWDGSSWHSMDVGVNDFITSFIEREGRLLVGGTFTMAGGRPANYLAWWDGQKWLSWDSEPDGNVRDIVEFHGDIIICGSFCNVGQESTPGIARWNGETWRTIGGGFSRPGSEICSASDLQVIGDRLYVSGVFRVAGDNVSYNLACWEEDITGANGHWVGISPALNQNHPNPFNPETKISFTLPDAASVSLQIYDPSGRLVSSLVDGEDYTSGSHQLTWNGLSNDGKQLASGVYFYQLIAGDFTETKKMTLLK